MIKGMLYKHELAMDWTRKNMDWTRKTWTEP